MRWDGTLTLTKSNVPIKKHKKYWYKIQSINRTDGQVVVLGGDQRVSSMQMKSRWLVAWQQSRVGYTKAEIVQSADLSPTVTCFLSVKRFYGQFLKTVADNNQPFSQWVQCYPSLLVWGGAECDPFLLLQTDIRWTITTAVRTIRPCEIFRVSPFK